MSGPHLHPFAALQQQEVTTLEKRGGKESGAHGSQRQQLQPDQPGLHTHIQRRDRAGSFLFFFLSSHRIEAMPLKNSNAVAVERRMDLASLFCMIGRHGPAVALAVIAMVSVLAGFIIYRTVRGKRRKATDAAAAAADGDGGSPGGAQRDAAALVQASPEEARSCSAESTDVSDEGSSYMRGDVDLIQSDLKIRHRRAAAEKTPPPYSAPTNDIQVPENKHTTSVETGEEMAAVWDSCKVTYTEEASQSLQSDTCTVAEMVLEDAVSGHQGATDDITEDVIEEGHDNVCMMEPETINDENHEEEEKVLTAECVEAEDVTTDNDVSDKKTRQEEENFQCALNNPACFEQTPHKSENADENKTPLETNNMEFDSEEPVIHIEDVPVPCVCDDKDEEFKEENPESVDYAYSSSNNLLSAEEEKKVEGEEEVECVDYQLIVQQAETWSTSEEINVPSTQQDQSDHVTDEVTPPIQDSDWDEGGGLAGEAIEEVIHEDHLNKVTAVEFELHSPQFDKQEVEIEQKEDNGLTCNQEDGVLYDEADEVQEEMLTSDSIVACSEEFDSSNVAQSAALPSLSAPVKVDNHDDSLSDILTDAKAQISDVADFPDLSSDYHQPQTEDKTSPSLDEDTDSTVLGPQMKSHETENQSESNVNATIGMLAEESKDQVYDPHVQSCYEDQQSVQMINNEISEEVSVAAGAGTAENETASVTVEEISCPPLPSICYDQQNDGMENEETFDKTTAGTAIDATACNNASLTALVMSEEISRPDMLSFFQDQQSDQMKNNEDFSEVATGAAPVMTEDISPPMSQINLPSFEQSQLRDNDISSPGVGEESGISSMAVSPDLQDAGNEFDMTIEKMVLPVTACDLQSEGQTGAQNSLFADDVVLSGINEGTGGMVFGPYPSRPSQPPKRTFWTDYESFATNEDTFGHEIEDSYHREFDQFTAQIANTVTIVTDELEKQTDMKAGFEVVEIKVKKAEVSVEKKKGTKEEKEKEEDYEKTEISIMEATMDHNEWITESNYQVPPWMNVSATSFTQDHTKTTNQPPTQECEHSCAATDTTCIDATDIPPSTEVKQASTLSPVDENTENNKKVVAVQPMPQNVNVTFRIHYFTESSYQTVAVTGDQQELGNWKGFIPLEKAKDGHWSTVVSLPAESHVEWKFVVVDKGEVCRWEECGNRLLDTGYGEDLLVHKWWGLL